MRPVRPQFVAAGFHHPEATCPASWPSRLVATSSMPCSTKHEASVTTVSPKGQRMLEPVGITHLEEQIYGNLLERPGSSLRELARSVSASPPRIRAALTALEAKGLVNRTPGQEPRFMPARPDVAVEILILQRKEDLEKVRLGAEQLLERFLASVPRTRPIELVEVVTGREGLVQQFEQLQRSANREVLLLDRPPYAQTENEGEIEVLASGVRYRVVYDRSSLESSSTNPLDTLERYTSVGEQARVLDGVPMKLAVADERVALVPLNVREAGAEGAIIIYARPLIDALRTLFEALWERAVPTRLTTSDPGPDKSTARALSSEDRNVLVLLAAGLTDEAIASQLDMGLRTVQRRIRRIMDLVGAHSRFQAGIQAAKRGWL